MADQASGIFSPFLRRRRIAAALPFLKGRVLDYGCGIGALTEYFSPENYIGIDDDKASLSIAKKTHPAYVFLYTDELCMIEGVFDSIALLAVIEHVHDAEILLRLLGSLLEQNGSIVLTTPLPMAGLLHRFGACIGLFSKEAHNDHKAFYGHKEIAAMAQSAGFGIAVEKRFLFGMNQLCILKKK